MADESEVTLALRSEEWEMLRHYENQRAALTNLVIVVASIVIGFIAQTGVQESTLPLSILLIILGVYGVASNVKLYERIHLANDLALAYTARLDELEPDIGIERIRKQVRARHKTEFPVSTRLKMNYLWLTLHAVIALLGVILLVSILW